MMNCEKWLIENNIDLHKYHGNIGDLKGNICIEKLTGEWIFWGSNGIENIPKKYWG